MVRDSPFRSRYGSTGSGMIITRCDIIKRIPTRTDDVVGYLLSVTVRLEDGEGTILNYPGVSVITSNENDILKLAFARVVQMRKVTILKRNTQDIINSQLPYRRES